jgi:hypothetical protein
MNISSQLDIKPLYRVTGTPENFLTALRHSLWGFNNEKVQSWNSLSPGDIMFFHSKGADSKFLSKPQSSIIGFGVVGDNFYFDQTPLWIDEIEDGKSYPHRFSFSEIYLFAEIPINDNWDSASLKKKENTVQLLNRLLEASIPLSDLAEFPKMGSYSAIQNMNVKKALLDNTRQLRFYRNKNYSQSFNKSTPLQEMKNDHASLRYATSLSVFSDIRKRVINRTDVNINYSLDKLAEADSMHFDIVKFLKNILKEKGYQIYYNNHVDLFAHKKDRSLLVEAKSIENENFKPQSRKGIIQLFEYNYFEINKFKKDNDLKFNTEFKVLATSDEPRDKEYVNFINSLDIKTLAVRDNRVVNYGDSISFVDL